MFLFIPTPPAANSARIVVFDVGQGLAVAVQTARHTLLFDTGPDFAGEADSGNRILVPSLRALGIARLDGLILSHSDLDHVGGTTSVRQGMAPEWIKTSIPADHPLLAGAPEVSPCHDGDRWEWDGVSFEILHPPAAPVPVRQKKNNDSSCVLRISTGDLHVLLAGDIEHASEARLLRQHRDKLPATLLVAPHHGSGSSSTRDFVAAVSPRHVVFTSGYRNRFHHPHPAVVGRYLRSGSQLLRSDSDGAILAEMDKEGLSLVSYRKEHRRYWTHHAAE